MASAIESLKSNRKRLHEKTNRFRQRKTANRNSKTHTNRKRKVENTRQLKLADKKRRNKIMIEIGLIAFISIIGTVFLLQWSHQFISKQLVSYHTDIKNIELSAANASRKEGYFTLIERGNLYLANQDWQFAQSNFNRALTLFPKGKRANLGLTKSLIYQCKYENRYCKEARSYFNQSGIYSKTTINKLSLLIKK